MRWRRRSSSQNTSNNIATTTSGSSATTGQQQHQQQQRRRRDNDDDVDEGTTTVVVAGGSGGGGGGAARAEELVILSSKKIMTIYFLRAAVLALLVISGALICAGVNYFTKKDEEAKFVLEYEADAEQIIDSFQNAVDNRLDASHALSAAITSYALDTNKTFPFVTVPNFAIIGSSLRVHADSMIVHWIPLVTDEDRDQWEEYALENRHHIDKAFAEDARLRKKQDETFGFVLDLDGDDRGGQNNGGGDDRDLRMLDETQQEEKKRNETILDDGTGYHPRIWASGAVGQKGDEPEGTGPYLPLWQRSPINGAKQKQLNMNAGNSVLLRGVLPVMNKTNNAVMNRAVIPIPSGRDRAQKNLALGQFRHNLADELVDDPITFLAYPVFDSFDEDRRLAGVVVTNIFWKLFFKNILPHSTSTSGGGGIICVLENSFNQTLVYRVEGPDVTYLGETDPHDEATDGLVFESHVNSYVEKRAGPETRAYLASPLDQEFGRYTLRIYPEFGVRYTDRPWIYAVIVAAIMFFTSVVYIVFACAVERRQQIATETALANARKAAATERELNEFLAHEVRNPLAAAISACSFVDATIQESKQQQPYPRKDDNENNKYNMIDPAIQKLLEEDVKIISGSLHFINDFMRSMLDSHRAAASQIELRLAPTDLLKDVIEPVCSMLYNQRDADVEIVVDCPENLLVRTDALRLKQVVLNLGRNATKFVQSGFIRFRAAVVSPGGLVEVYVEDSGPGIPEEKRGALFQKYQTSLDALSQGTGIGLSLSKSLMEMLKGNLYLDQDYRSGVSADQPGAGFVVQLNQPPMQLTGLFASCSMSMSFSELEKSSATCSLEEGSSLEFKQIQYSSSRLRRLPSMKQLRQATIHEELGSSNGSSFSSVVVRDNNNNSHNEMEEMERDGEHLPAGWNVLFVDDDLVLRKLFMRTIRKVAPTWTVHESANGETALRLATTAANDGGGATAAATPRRPRYDLIFIDQYMASAEKQWLGTETVRALRANGVTSLLVGLSANEITANSFIQAGADAFLSKPIPCRPDELRAALRSITAASGPPERRTIREDVCCCGTGGGDSGGDDAQIIQHVADDENAERAPSSSLAVEGVARKATEEEEKSSRQELDAMKCGEAHSHKGTTEIATLHSCTQGDPVTQLREDERGSAASLSSSPCGHAQQERPSGCSSSQGASAGGGTTTEQQQQLLDNLSILFVDDDSMLRKLFSRAVKKAAPTWKIDDAPSGERALEMVAAVDDENDENDGAHKKKCHYDLIFMDQYMSSTEEKTLLGTETVEALRGRGVTSVVCGLSANDVEEQFLSAGADFFLSKPIPCRPNDLKRELLRLTQRIVKHDSDEQASEDETAEIEKTSSLVCVGSSCTKESNKTTTQAAERAHEKTVASAEGEKTMSSHALNECPVTPSTQASTLFGSSSAALWSPAFSPHGDSGGGSCGGGAAAGHHQRLHDECKSPEEEKVIARDTTTATTTTGGQHLRDGLSILFVDDDAILRKLFSRAVRKVVPSWNIDGAPSGETALLMVDARNYDLIFMDQYMSSAEEKKLLGTETVEALRTKGVTSVVCGLSANEVEGAFLSAGAEFFLPKPIPCRPDELKRELLRLTRGIASQESDDRAKQDNTAVAGKNEDALVGVGSLFAKENNHQGTPATVHAGAARHVFCGFDNKASTLNESKANALHESIQNTSATPSKQDTVSSAMAEALTAQLRKQEHTKQHTKQHSSVDCATADKDPDASDFLPENLSILFVDDDAMLRKLFSRAIKKAAPTWKTSEAPSGERALEMIQSRNFDLIFMDQYMSSTEEKKLLGTETVEALRARNVKSTICGLSANDVEGAFANAGADFFLLKPIPCRPKDLKRELRRMTVRVEKEEAGVTEESSASSTTRTTATTEGEREDEAFANDGHTADTRLNDEPTASFIEGKSTLAEF